jgi:hypothetical protein
MSEMEGGTKRFGESICRINNTRDVAKDDIAVGFPLLDRKMLDVDVS